MAKAKILVVDDEELIRWSFEKELSNLKYEVITAESGEEAINKFKENPPDLVLLDIRLPGMDGLETLKEIHKLKGDTLAIMMTAEASVQNAVKAMKMRAVVDYLCKPVDFEELKVVVENAIEIYELRKEVKTLRDETRKPYSFENIIVNSEKMKQVLDTVSRVIQSKAGIVLVQGESGTGKDLVAKTIHYKSERCDKPFMEINCAALPETLLESELFGYEKGAFTDAKFLKKGLFELADEGTVFLDEIGDMKTALQAKLLKVIENRYFKRVGGANDIEVDIKIITATNRDLKKLVDSGEFRADLYYRLNVISIYIPPLRERKEDIYPLIKHFLGEFNRSFKKNIKDISPGAKEILLNYNWPGNVRELKNVIERAIILSFDDLIDQSYLPMELLPDYKKEDDKIIDITLPPDGIDIDKIEEELVRQALSLSQGNQTVAAKLLNLTRDSFRRRLKKYDLL